MKPLNILPLIQRWLDEHWDNSWNHCSLVPRDVLEEWVKGKVPVEQEALAVDCLMAAGIGRPEEQNMTVYGGYSGFND